MAVLKRNIHQIYVLRVSKWKWNWCNVFCCTEHIETCVYCTARVQRDFKSMSIILFASIFRPCYCCVFHSVFSHFAQPNHGIAPTLVFLFSGCVYVSVRAPTSAHVLMVWKSVKEFTMCTRNQLHFIGFDQKKGEEEKQQYTANRPFGSNTTVRGKGETRTKFSTAFCCAISLVC